jgi:hypothetical protein
MRFFVVFIFLAGILRSQTSEKRSGNGTRLMFGPVLGFYTINLKHARNPGQKMSAVIGIRREIRIDHDFRTFLLVGADYFFHGLNFNSYYFRPDSLQLYNKNFNYTYSLVIHELNFPIQLKFLFRREDNKLHSPYLIAGWHLRWLMASNLRITENGQKVKDDSPPVSFRIPLLDSSLNSFVSLGIGWQKNSLRSSKGSFFIELNGRYGFSDYYIRRSYTASSLFINAVHLTLLIGTKF